MARFVVHDTDGPRKLDESDLDEEKGDIAICQCGLSAEYPFCDGTHRTVADEDDRLYVYERDGDELERRVVEDVVTTDE